MGPIRRSRGVNKRYSYYYEVSPIRHEESADRRSRQKRKLVDPLGPRWSKEEIEHFYELYRKHGKDWKKVAAGMRNRSIEMVEALYSTNRAYLSLPEGTASVAGLIAMMTDHYANLDGSDNEKQSNDGPGTSRKPQKHGLGKAQAKIFEGSRRNLLSPSQEVASSYGHLQISKKQRSVGSRPRAVGKRTPRIPVSFSYENKNSEKLISPTKQGISNADSDDAELAEIAKTLTEVSHRGGSPQVSFTPRRTVGSCDNDEDGSNQGAEADNGDFPRTNSSRMRDGNIGMTSQNGKRRYGNIAEACNGKNHLDEIREAWSGTGQILDAGDIFGTDVTNAKFSRSSHDPRKRSKKVLFGRDKGSDLHPLEFLADCSLMPEMANDNGLPHYDPELVEKMNKSNASKALASQLKKLAGVHQVKVPVNRGPDSESVVGAGTGSSVQKEGGGESQAPHQVEAPEVETARAKKKQKVCPGGEDMVLGLDQAANPGGSGSGGDGPRKKNEYGVGNLTMRELGEFVASIPEEKDWQAMDRSAMPDMVKRMLVVWTRAGILLAGACANSRVEANKIMELTRQLSEKDKELVEKNKQISEQELKISELKDALAASAGRVSGLEVDLKEAVDRAEAAVAEIENLKKQNGELEAELIARRPEEVIAAFKDSEEYVLALAGAAAEKLQRCWFVAEKHIKTDAESSFGKFIDLYMAAEDAFDRDRTEPEPYSGPNPIFPQVSTTVEAQTELVNRRMRYMQMAPDPAALQTRLSPDFEF